MGIPPDEEVRVVLNDDGTEVDSDVLSHFKSEVLIMMRPHQEWSDPGSDQPRPAQTEADPEIDTEPQTEQDC